MELSGRDYWKTSDIFAMVERRSGIKYTTRHVRRFMQKWGYSLMTPIKKHGKSVSPEEVEQFKRNQQKYQSLRKGMSAVCMDESAFVYDSIIKRV